jgi:hypothetical protein
VVDTTAFRQKAAGTFSLPPFHVPRGPYTLWYLAIRVLIGKSLAYARAISSAGQTTKNMNKCIKSWGAGFTIEFF